MHDRILAYEQNLIVYVAARRLEGVAVARGKRIPKHDQVVVNALLDGIFLYEFRSTVRKSADFHRVVDDPRRTSDVRHEKREKQGIR